MKHTLSQILRFLFVPFFIAACSLTPVSKPRMNKVSRAVIFVPGYKGSILKEKGGGDTVWVSLSEILFGERSLALGGSELGIENSVQVEPAGIFERLSVIPILYRYHVYDLWLSYLQRALSAETTIIKFGYDWRQDIAEVASKLEEVVDGLQRRGVQDISIVSHSMGGLVAAYFLRYGSQPAAEAVENWAGAKQVHRVVFAGAPFRGSLAILDDFQSGNPTWLNDSLLNREALGTFHSSYQLLPRADDSPLFGTDGTPISFDFFNAEIWDEYRWGLLGDALSDPIHGRRKAIIEARLRGAKVISDRIVGPSSMENKARTGLTTRYLAFIGLGHSTQSHAVIRTTAPKELLFLLEDIRKTIPDFPLGTLLEDGDGTVTRNSASVPEAYAKALRGEDWFGNVEHSQFFDDEEVRKKVVEFLSD